MDITKHAEKRMRERVNASKSSTVRQATLALERGYRYSDTKGNLSKFLNKQQMVYKTGAELRVYNNHVFIFTRSLTLITVLPLPTDLQKQCYLIKRV